MPRGGFLETRRQHAETTLAQAELQVGPVAEVHVQQRARNARAARDLIHRQPVDAALPGHGLGGIEDLVAPAVFLFQPAIGDIVHAAKLPEQ